MKTNNKIIKKIISLVLTVFMLATYIPTHSVDVFADGIEGFTTTKGNDAFVNGMTLANNTIYKLTANKSLTSGSYNGAINLAAGTTAVLYIAKDVTLTVTGSNASGATGAKAGIYLPTNATLIITGEGKVVANGGNGANGLAGSDGTNAERTGAFKTELGVGGAGGAGGGGAGAGIGGKGGNGGSAGNKGSNDGTSCGTLYILGKVTVQATGGSKGSAGGAGAAAGSVKTHAVINDSYTRYYGGGGGGAGGGSGGGAYGIGCGGSGGGGGSNGADGTYNTSHVNDKTVVNGKGGHGGAGGKGYTEGVAGANGAGKGTLTTFGAGGDKGSSQNLYVSSTASLSGQLQASKQTKNDFSKINYSVVLDYADKESNSTKVNIAATLGANMPTINMPARNGYSFKSFSTGKNGTGTIYYQVNNNTIASSRTWDIINSSTTLYGLWAPNTYTISLNNGEGISDTSLSVTYDKPVDSIVPPEKDGYVFEGYYTAENGGGRLVFGPNGVPVSADGSEIVNQTWKGLNNLTLYAKWMELTGTAIYSETYKTTRNIGSSETYYFGSINLYLRNQKYTGQCVELRSSNKNIVMAEEIDNSGLTGKYSLISNEPGTYKVFVNGEDSGKTLTLTDQMSADAQNIYMFATDVEVKVVEEGNTAVSFEETVVLKSSSTTLTPSDDNKGHYIVYKFIDNQNGDSTKYRVILNGLDTGKDVAFNTTDFDETITLYHTNVNVKLNNVNSNEPGSLSLVGGNGNTLTGLKAKTIKDNDGNSSVVTGSYIYESLASESYNLYLNGNSTGVSVSSGNSKTLDYYSLDVALKLDGNPLKDANVSIVNGTDNYSLTPDNNGNYKIIRLKSDTAFNLVVDGEVVSNNLVFNKKNDATINFRTLTVNVTKDGSAYDPTDDLVLKTNNNSITLSKAEAGKYQTRVLVTTTPNEFDIYVGNTDTGVNVKSNENATVEYNIVTLNLNGGTANFDTSYVGIKGNTLSLTDKTPIAPENKTFSGWFNDSNKVETVGFDNTVTLNAQYEDIKYPYIVFYMIQKDLTEEYELYDHVTLQGVAGSNASIDDLDEFASMDITRDAVKYVATGINEREEEITVQTDGRLQVFVYYKNDTVNITYKAGENVLKVDTVLKNKPTFLYQPNAVDNKYLQHWKIEGTSEEYVAGSSYIPTNNVVMSGSYLVPHSLTFNFDGGQTISRLTDDTREKLSDPIVYSNLTKGLKFNPDSFVETEREHYIFQYWYDETNKIIYSSDTTGESLNIAEAHSEYDIKDVLEMPEGDVTIKPYWYYPTKNVKLNDAIDTTKLVTDRYKIITQSGFVDKNLGPDATYKFKVALNNDTKYVFDSTPITVKYKTDQSEDTFTLTADANGVYTIEEIWENIIVIVETPAKQSMAATNTDITVDPIADIEASGNKETPTVTVKNEGVAITLDSDYEVTYGTNKWTGQANAGSVTITGLDDYKGSRTVYFNIVDTAKPTGKIEIGTNIWNTFLNTITFGNYFKQTQSVKITASDAGSGVKVIKYYVSNSALTSDQVIALTNWSTYSNTFNIDPNNKYVVYAKITDNALNTMYLSSDGLVFDNVAPVIEGIENNKTYCDDVTFTVTDAYLDSVKLDGDVITPVEGKYSITADWNTHTVVASDKSGNTTTYTVKVNPEHVWNYTDNNNKLIATCISDATHTATLTLSSNSINYSGEAYAVSNVAIGTENERTAWSSYDIDMPLVTSVLFYVDDTTLTNTQNSGALAEGSVPKDAGNYIAKLTIVEDTNTATAKSTFTINKVNSSIASVPTAKTLTYNGANQTLLNAGTNVVGGTLKYSLTQTGEYSETIPTKKDAGTYDVYYKVFGDSNHNDTNVTKITVTIAKKDITISNIKVENKTYDGNTTSTLNYDGVEYAGIVDGEVLSVTATGTFSDKNASNNAKTVNISNIELHDAEDKDYLKNYELATSGQQTTATANITKKDITTTITPNGGTYDSTINAATAVLNNTVANDSISPVITYTGNDNAGVAYTGATTAPTNAGTYTITVTLDGTDKDNYNLTGTVTDTFTVAKAKVTAPTKYEKVFTYNGQEQTYTLVTNSLYEITNNVKTDAGTYTVNVALIDKDNYLWSNTSDALDKTYNFVINPAKSEDVKAILEKVVLAKTGEKIKAPLNLTYLGMELVEGIDFNIEDNIKIEAGKYTLTVTLIGNYKGTITKDWSINEVVGAPINVELEPIEINGELTEFEGELNIIVSSAENAPSITIETPLNVLSESEILALANDKVDIDIIVTLNTLVSEDLDEKSLEAIDEISNKTKNIRYLDITIDKVLKHKVNDKVVNVETIPVTETEEEVEITVDVPKTIPGVSSGYKRTYTIIRSHLTEVEPEEGQESQDPQFEYVAKKLDTKYSNGTLTFKTNLFSDYAVMYVDTLIPVPSDSTADTNYKAPNTGVTATATQGLVELGAIAVGSLFAVISNKKKKEN